MAEVTKASNSDAMEKIKSFSEMVNKIKGVSSLDTKKPVIGGAVGALGAYDNTVFYRILNLAADTAIGTGRPDFFHLPGAEFML